MTPQYYHDMQVVDERLTALERKVESILSVLIRLQECLINNERSTSINGPASRVCLYRKC